MTGELLVETRNATVRFGAHVILSNVSVAVHRGEIVSLIGPNGAGKTTLVRVVLGLQDMTSGTVFRRPGLHVGYMPQTLHIDESLPLTVARFLTLGARVSSAEIAKILDEVGAGYLGRAQMQELSGGELRRVLLARALLRAPELLVLDEPVQGVDITGQADLYALIGHVKRHFGCGVLMVSHDLHVVMASTDRVVCLNRHVCCTGQPEDVSRDPEYQALFGPGAAKYLAVYTHGHGHGHDHRHDEHGNVLPLPGKEPAGANAAPKGGADPDNGAEKGTGTEGAGHG